MSYSRILLVLCSDAPSLGFPIPTPCSAVDFSGRRSLLSAPCSPIPALGSAVDLSSSNFFALFYPIPNPHSPVKLTVRHSFLPYPYSSPPVNLSVRRPFLPYP